MALHGWGDIDADASQYLSDKLKRIADGTLKQEDSRPYQIPSKPAPPTAQDIVNKNLAMEREERQRREDRERQKLRDEVAGLQRRLAALESAIIPHDAMLDKAEATRPGTKAMFFAAVEAAKAAAQLEEQEQVRKARRSDSLAPWNRTY